MQNLLCRILACSIVIFPAAASAGERLTVASWGGTYAQNQLRAIIEPFRKAGYDVALEQYAPSPEVAGPAIKTNAGWDVVNIETQTATSACKEGLLEKIDWSRLGLDRSKFVGANGQDCAVPNVVYGTVLSYDSHAWNGRTPSKITDLFDLNAFPGKRGLRKSPVVSLEWALIADGVLQADIYRSLRTKAGIDRAFKKLDTIKDQIVWWEDGSDPVRLLDTHTVVMTSAWNGRITEAVHKNNKPFGIVWDNQGLDWVWWAIAKASPSKDAAYKFVAFASDPDRLAEQTKDLAYGPANTDAFAKIDKGTLADLPTSGPNMKSALIIDAKFWAANGAELRRRFQAWAAKASRNSDR